MATVRAKKAFMLMLWLTSSAFVTNAQSAAVIINIDPHKTHQIIVNFGASDAWSCQFVGNWPDAKRNKIADLLFSQDTLADGSPKGIALSLWRFNVGAGSTQQGDQSDIKDEWRRAESFLNFDGTYNWQNQAGQQWFLKAAKARGVKQFLAFSNSPPVQCTLNGKAHANKGKTNIAPEQYGAFANYLSNVVKGIEKQTQIKFNYISPVNEPQWDWNGGQEGCPYNNTEISNLVRSINKSFINNHITSKILIAEAGNSNFLWGSGSKGNQIHDFFDKNSANYIGDLECVSKTIAAHSYFTTSPMASAIQSRQALSETIATITGLNYWQSEYCILGDNAGEINGSKRDLGIDAALYLAKVIHTDLTSANASAWQWWTAISPYDYKDGLIYIDKNKPDGNYYTSKMLWALGNYSRFVRPGAIRVDANIANNTPLAKPLLISAYADYKKMITVIVNENTTNVAIKLNIAGSRHRPATSYTTSEIDELKPDKIADPNAPILIAPRSITTLITSIN
jgi:O-glycosyl hydrolase